MYLHAISHYVPENVLTNAYFSGLNGLTDDWIFSRTGIKERRKAGEGENADTMSVEAVTGLFEKSQIKARDIDLILTASYSPFDTVGTIAHKIQQNFSISDAKALYLSSACSSFINAAEIVQAFFQTGKSSKALVTAAEHNSLYNNEHDERSGHLWGDGSAAVIFTKERIADTDFEVVDITTHGLGHVGRGPEGVYLEPTADGLVMPYGKDVFIHACNHMEKIAREILKNNNFSIDDLDYLIPHQANIRIINQVVEKLGIHPEQSLNNIEYLGNTGCASAVISLSENIRKIEKGNLMVITVFGGGYSSGAMLLKA